MTSSFSLNTLKPQPGSRRRKLRKGRGIAAGQGASCGFGMRGQKSRSGRPVRPGFEGGQMPLYRKLPHRGFNNYEFRTSYAVVNVGDLARLDAAISEVNAEVLAQAGLVRRGIKTLKILGDGEITRALKVTAQKFTGSAKAKLEKAGGQAITT